LTFAYVALIAGAVTIFALIHWLGARLGTPAPPVLKGAATAQAVPLMNTLVSMAMVLATATAVGCVVSRLGQPRVIGELLAGVLLGPSFFGGIMPHLATYLLPATVMPYIAMLAQLGVVLYMFQVGLQLDVELIRGRAHSAAFMSHASIIVPLVFGAALALFLYPRFSTNDVSFLAFGMFVGVAMAVAAFPVLARILNERGLSRTHIGAMALTCAAVDDVTAWLLLAVVVGLVRHANTADAVATLASTVLFIAVSFTLVRPLLRGLAGRVEARATPRAVLASALAGLLISAAATEWIGIHAVFGAFIFGAVIPRDSSLARSATQRLEGLTVLLLPAYFAFTGMRTEVGLVSGWMDWALCGVIICTATAGKLGGTFTAARLAGMERSSALRLGILLNTRGLMELVVLNIALELHVISPELFTMMVIMAVVTTMMTTPVLQWLDSRDASVNKMKCQPMPDACDLRRHEDSVPPATLVDVTSRNSLAR